MMEKKKMNVGGVGGDADFDFVVVKMKTNLEVYTQLINTSHILNSCKGRRRKTRDKKNEDHAGENLLVGMMMKLLFVDEFRLLLSLLLFFHLLLKKNERNVCKEENKMELGISQDSKSLNRQRKSSFE